MRAAVIGPVVIARDAERAGGGEELLAALPEPFAELRVVRVARERQPRGGEAPRVLRRGVEVHAVVRRRQARHVAVHAEPLREVVARALLPGAAPRRLVGPRRTAGERRETAAEVEPAAPVQS